MLKIARFLKDYKKQVILGPIFKLIEAIFELIVPIIMAKIIDIGIQNKDISYVLKMGFLLVLIGIISLSFFTYLSTLCSYCISRLWYNSKK